MRLEISQFGGMAPLVDPTALSDSMATLARNVRLDRGVLAPSAFNLVESSDYPDSDLSGRGIRSVAKLFDSNTRFAFSHPRGAMAFPSPVSPADTWGRAYFMTASGPSFTTTDSYSPGGVVINPVSYRLGIAPPSDTPSVGEILIESKFRDGEMDPETGEREQVLVDPDRVSVAYVYTFVDKYGHESAPSRASLPAVVAYDRGFTVEVSMASNLPANTNFEAGVRRIYRAAFDGQSSRFQYLDEVPINQTVFVDSTPVGQEAEDLITEGWLPAPGELQNLCLVSSAFAAGYIDGYVCYSELKLPHAWPAELQYPIKYSPKGLMPLLNGLLIVTSGRPYWAEGADPYSAIPRELPINAPCVSAESVVDMGGYAMYVSEEGLVVVGPDRAEVVTRELLDRGQMSELVDEDCTAFKFEDRYVFSTKDGRWMAFVPQRGLVEYEFGHPPSAFSSVTFSVRDNRHIFAFSDGAVREVDFAQTATGVEWRSKLWRTPPASFSAVRVEADNYPVTIQVRCQYLAEEWEETPEFEVTGPHIQRLPVMTGGLWQVIVKPPSGGRVYRVIMAQSGQEAA